MTDGGGLPVVVGQGGEVVVEIGGVDGLDRVGDAPVEAPPTDGGQVGRERLGNEGVREPHLVAGGPGLLHQADEERRLQRVERGVGAGAARLGKHVDPHSGARHRGHAQHGPRVIGQALDPPAHDVAHARPERWSRRWRRAAAGPVRRRGAGPAP